MFFVEISYPLIIRKLPTFCPSPVRLPFNMSSFNWTFKITLPRPLRKSCKNPIKNVTNLNLTSTNISYHHRTLVFPPSKSLRDTCVYQHYAGIDFTSTKTIKTHCHINAFLFIIDLSCGLFDSYVLYVHQLHDHCYCITIHRRWNYAEIMIIISNDYVSAS